MTTRRLAASVSQMRSGGRRARNTELRGHNSLKGRSDRQNTCNNVTDLSKGTSLAVDVSKLASALGQALAPVIAATMSQMGFSCTSEGQGRNSSEISTGNVHGEQGNEHLPVPNVVDRQSSNEHLDSNSELDDQEQHKKTPQQSNNQQGHDQTQINILPNNIDDLHLSNLAPGGQANSGVQGAEQVSSSSWVDGPTFVPSKLPLYAMVPMKKREQIWRGEFVELSTLQEEEPDDVLFNMKTGKISPAPSKKRFLTIEQWTDAFSIYASVYRIKYPQEAEALASYMSLVRRIASERGAWFNYDRQFRKLKANSTSLKYKWDQREDELFFLALNKR